MKREREREDESGKIFYKEGKIRQQGKQFVAKYYDVHSKEQS